MKEKGNKAIIYMLANEAGKGGIDPVNLFSKRYLGKGVKSTQKRRKNESIWKCRSYQIIVLTVCS